MLQPIAIFFIIFTGMPLCGFMLKAGFSGSIKVMIVFNRQADHPVQLIDCCIYVESAAEMSG